MDEQTQQRIPAVAVELPVRFAETDAMGVVHHSNYVVWFEAGRIAWMDAVGVPYVEVAAGGNHFAVTGLEVAYRQSARFGDLIRLLTRVEEIRSRKVSFRYEVSNAHDGVLLATGRTEHICVDLDGRVAKIPSHIVMRLQEGAAALATEKTVV